MEIEILTPHGFCAGVTGALEKARRLADGRAAEGAPIYCLHEIVHNELVVADLTARGFVFVESVADVPEGATVLFSAHGVSPSVRAAAAARKLRVVDATCPFVARVHVAARAFAERGLPVVVIGKADHAEVKGIIGEIEDAGGNSVVVSNAVDAKSVRVPPVDAKSVRVPPVDAKSVRVPPVDAKSVRVPPVDAKSVRAPPVDAESFPRLPIGVVSQTTMNADEVEKIVAALRARFAVETMADVCRATKVRQDAVRAFRGDALLVLGSVTSSNTRRLCEVAACRTFRAGTLGEVKALDLTGVRTLGVTAGASTPEDFFQSVLDALKPREGGLATPTVV